MPSFEFWKEKKVLVTGAAGFVGSHLAKSLTAQGAIVFGVCRPEALLNFQKIYGSGFRQEQYFIPEHGSLGNLKVFQAFCEKEGIDTIFHMAALVIVSKAAKNPLETLQNNILMTVNILEVARRIKVQRVLFASSDKVYGDHSDDNLETLPFEESYTLRGMDIYSVSKVCGDIISQAYGLQYKLPVAAVRCCNIYGPGDVNFTRLIPKTAMLLLSGKPPIIKAGHAKVLREYLYIDDAVRAYLFIAENIKNWYEGVNKSVPNKGKSTYGWAAFNVGSYSGKDLSDIKACNNIASVTDIISMLREKITDIAPVVVEKSPEYIEIPDEFLDSAKLLNLGFKSRVKLKEGLSLSVDWYKANKDKFIK